MVNDWAIFLLGCALPIMYVAGFVLGKRQSGPPNDEQIARYMGRIVNQEEVEEHQRLLKFRMARNGRKTIRYDSGPNARIGKMRVRPVARRFRR